MLERPKHSEVEPLFEPGHYKYKYATKAFNDVFDSLRLLDGFSVSAGMPLRWNGVSFLVEPATRLIQLNEVVGAYRFALAIRTASGHGSDPLKTVFSRTRVACLSSNETNDLLTRCAEAIGYWSSQFISSKGEPRNYAFERLQVFIEVLARVSVRATPEQAVSFPIR